MWYVVMSHTINKPSLWNVILPSNMTEHNLYSKVKSLNKENYLVLQFDVIRKDNFLGHFLGLWFMYYTSCQKYLHV